LRGEEANFVLPDGRQVEEGKHLHQQIETYFIYRKLFPLFPIFLFLDFVELMKGMCGLRSSRYEGIVVEQDEESSGTFHEIYNVG